MEQAGQALWGAWRDLRQDYCFSALSERELIFEVSEDEQEGKEKASTIAKVENHLAKAQSEAEAFFQSINLDD